MAITVNDLKLVESEVMSNAANSGGGATNNVIIDGMSNNLFDDVTQQDRVYGKVNQRKVFAAVRTTNTDKLMSAMAYVSKLPKDAKINVNLAQSNYFFDRVADRTFKEKKEFKHLEYELRLNSTLVSTYANPSYKLNGSKNFNAAITEATGNQIKIIGIDGIINQSRAYGAEGLKNIFKNNSFLIKQGNISETIFVKDVSIFGYSDASQDSDNYPFFTSDYQGIDTTLFNTRPMYQYEATLTLTTNITSAFTEFATWENTGLWFSATKAKLFMFSSENVEKFYSAKKITSAISIGANAIPIAENLNQVIPVIPGVNLESERLGVDLSDFTIDGEYVAYSPNDVILILNYKQTTGTYTNGQTVTLTRQNLAKVTVRDSAGNLIDSAKFSANLTAGTVQFIDVSGLSQPLTITDRIEDLGLVTSVSDTILTLHKPLKNAYPVEGTIVSNCCLFGTLYASVSKPFDQQTWTNVWSDAPIGSTVTAQYDFNNYPIVVNNLNAVTDRWAIIFTSSTTFNLVSEQFGQIVTGQSVSTDLEPINPNTGQPYFTLPTLGLGGGWSSGNVIRFNTYAAAAPFWVLQSISQGEATDPDFDFAIEVRGDIDAA